MKEIQNAGKGVAPSVRGLEIASRFFWGVGLPAIEAHYGAYVDRLAAGLVAAGSDCAGNDDEISRDCDWGPRFQVYLTQQDFAAIGADLQMALDDLPNTYDGIECTPSAPHPNHVFSIDGFFLECTSEGQCRGFAAVPERAADWLRIPEPRLFDVTRGHVFYDPLGEFSARRQGFAAYYPDDAWKKRLAAALLECGEQGQVLLPRALARDDFYTAEIAWWRFVEAAMKLGFLLCRRYAPTQKWLYREYCKLPGMCLDVTNLLWDGQCDFARRPEFVERIACIYDVRMAELGVGDTAEARRSAPLSCLAQQVQASISDPEVAKLATSVDLVSA